MILENIKSFWEKRLIRALRSSVYNVQRQYYVPVNEMNFLLLASAERFDENRTGRFLTLKRGRTVFNYKRKKKPEEIV